ncbi:energy transducer TonB [Parabacteroides sp. FAFU027]|uniref:energy transducer TonB n=1 Tax=Parabacteroides sp. FAFU027 TaxID=2922715 RepID=UPI001FAE7FE4|nr:energy transducer TonB [Parabacteroides sp. FAFU027]
MTKRTYLIQLMLFVAAIVYGQDTLFFEANGLEVKSMELASYYSVFMPDTTYSGNIANVSYWKSGKLKSYQPMILQFKNNPNKDIINLYTSGQVAWNDPFMKNYIEKLRTGIYKEWYDNGQLKVEAVYAIDKYNGYYNSYWPNGQPKRRDTYKKNKLINGTCYSKEGEKIKYFPLEVMPEFPGGIDALMYFLRQNIRYPVTMQEKKIQGMVLVQFVVSKSGKPANIKIVKGLHPDGDREAIRVVSLMPDWTSGVQDGDPVPVLFTLPIRFNLE